MRRFHGDHEGIIPDDSVVALWKCNEVSTSSGMVDSSYSARFQLVTAGSTALASPVFGASGNNGAQELTNANNGWFQTASASSWHLSMATNWSVGLWFRDTGGANTVALVEYATRESPAASGDMSPLGLYVNGDGSLCIQWDLSTTSLGHFMTVPGALPRASTRQFHIGVSKSQNASSALFVDVLATVNGLVVASTQMYGVVAGASNYNNSRWVVGASRRWGTGTGTSPAFTKIGAVVDDIGVWSVGLKSTKFAELYGNGARGWNERRLVDGNNQKILTRVFVEDGNSPSNMIDMSALYGVNWIKSVDVKEDVGDPINKATVKFMRYRGTTLNLSPLSQDSVLNQNAAAAFSALLDLRRKVRIEQAYVPDDWNIQGWEWSCIYDGFIDRIGWATDYVSVECLDRMAPLQDQFQLDAVPYDYYASAQLAETHIQNIINNNVPCVVTGVSLAATNLIFGYKGGTPALYTPASSGWVLNYDDTPAGPVHQMLQAVADQIGWDCRYKWYDPWQDYRLTFYAPPRTLTAAIASVSKDTATGMARVTFQQPHGLTEEQVLTISGTTNFNGSSTVQTVETVHTILTYLTIAGSPATETSGSVVYAVVYTFSDSQVQDFQEIKKDTQAIRNTAVVKYKRDSTTITVSCVTISGLINQAIQCSMSASAAFFLSQMSVGDPFTITDCGDANGNGNYTVGSFNNAAKITSSEQLPVNLTTSSGIFSSTIITRKMQVSANTVSIARYGLRQAAVYEASSGNIDTDREAKTLADAIVNDLADPTADMEITVPCAPWLELHDVVALNPDKKQRWTVVQNMAVTGLAHHFETGKATTRVTLRNASPTLGTTWVHRIFVSPFRPSIPDRFFPEVDTPTIFPHKANRLGHIFSMGMRPKSQLNGGGRRRLRYGDTEVHLSLATSGFIPCDSAASSTLASISRGNELLVHHDPLGNSLTPGTTYYVRLRQRDILGNAGGFSAATSLVARFQDAPAAAKVFAITAQSVRFRQGGWSPFPFTDKTSSPAFDTFGNYTLGVAAVIAPFCASVGTGGFWQMPCDGTLEVEARLGVRNSSTGFSKANLSVAFGIMRLGSSLPGGNASQPLAVKLFGPTEACTPWSPNSPLFIGTSGSVMFCSLLGRISAHSGDYIQIGVWPDWTVTDIGGTTNDVGCFVASAANTASVSASWAKFTVVAQD